MNEETVEVLARATAMLMLQNVLPKPVSWKSLTERVADCIDAHVPEAISREDLHLGQATVAGTTLTVAEWADPAADYYAFWLVDAGGQLLYAHLS